MKTIQRILLLALVASAMACRGPQTDHTVRVFVGSFTEAGGDGLYVHTVASGATARQLAPHAHAVLQEPVTGELYVPDLGADRTLIFAWQGDSLRLNAEIQYNPGAGPRHLEFHPGGNYMVTVNELDNTVSLFARDSAQRFTRPLQTITTLPGGQFDGETTSADIHFTADGRFLYASNRGENSIALYRFDAERGTIASMGWMREGIDFPRNFAIDPTGKFMLVANQKGNDIVVYALDAATGALTPTGHRIEALEPVCLKFHP